MSPDSFLSYHASAELGDDDFCTTEDALWQAIWDGLDHGRSAEDIAADLDVSVDRVRAVCGDRGHAWEVFADGDPSGPYSQAYTACFICGAPPAEDEP